MVIKDVQQWYSHTSSDLSHMINSGDEAWAADARPFLEDFPREVGFDFFSEAGFLRRMADRALRSGKIAKQSDYHALRELENDMSQAVLSSEELNKISKRLRAFENNMEAD